MADQQRKRDGLGEVAEPSDEAGDEPSPVRCHVGGIPERGEVDDQTGDEQGLRVGTERRAPGQHGRRHEGTDALPSLADTALVEPATDGGDPDDRGGDEREPHRDRRRDADQREGCEQPGVQRPPVAAHRIAPVARRPSARKRQVRRAVGIQVFAGHDHGGDRPHEDEPDRGAACRDEPFHRAPRGLLRRDRPLDRPDRHPRIVLAGPTSICQSAQLRWASDRSCAGPARTSEPSRSCGPDCDRDALTRPGTKPSHPGRAEGQWAENLR